jgi:hypothetical protein
MVAPGTGRQRYLCRTCGTTFNDYTNTLFHKSKIPELWPAFLKAMLDGLSIRQCARDVGISPNTAQAWRKKLLGHLAKTGSPALAGIVEYAEYTVKTSNKGQKTASSPLPKGKETVVFCKSRGGQVRVAEANDWRQREKAALGEAVIEATAIGETALGEAVIGEAVIGGSTLGETSDRKAAVRGAAVRKASLDKADMAEPTTLTASLFFIDHQSSVLLANNPINCASSAGRKLLHTRNVAPVVERFTLNYRRMRGVAGKYLPHYAAWHQFLEQSDGLQAKERVRQLLRICSSNNFI